MKIIKIYRGREFEAQVEESIKEDDFFIDEYRKATNLMEEILHSSIKLEDKNNKDDEKSVINNHTEYNNEYSAPQSQVNLLLRATCYAARSHP